MLNSISRLGETRTEQVEWNGSFRLFGFSRILGQPREVHPKFQNEIPEKLCLFHSLSLPEFPEFLVEWKAPNDFLTKRG